MLFADAEDGSHKTCLDQEPPDRAKSAMLLWKFEGGGGGAEDRDQYVTLLLQVVVL